MRIAGWLAILLGIALFIIVLATEVDDANKAPDRIDKGFEEFLKTFKSAISEEERAFALVSFAARCYIAGRVEASMPEPSLG